MSSQRAAKDTALQKEARTPVAVESVPMHAEF